MQGKKLRKNPVSIIEQKQITSEWDDKVIRAMCDEAKLDKPISFELISE